MNTVFKWYNQSIEYFTRNGCSIYTLFNIIQLQWGIKYDNDFIVKTAEEAEKDKKWFETRGAYFQVIYDWFATKIYDYTSIKATIKTVDINTDGFETLLNNGYYFGLGLLKAGKWYRKARADGVIDADDLDLDIGDTYGHNHTFGKLGDRYAIFDTLGTVTGNPIYMDLETLRGLVNKGVYYSNARTIVLKDQELDKRLRFFKKQGVIEDVDTLSSIERIAVDRALKLRTFKK